MLKEILKKLARALEIDTKLGGAAGAKISKAVSVAIPYVITIRHTGKSYYLVYKVCFYLGKTPNATINTIPWLYKNLLPCYILLQNSNQSDFFNL